MPEDRPVERKPPAPPTDRNGVQNLLRVGLDECDSGHLVQSTASLATIAGASGDSSCAAASAFARQQSSAVVAVEDLQSVYGQKASEVQVAFPESVTPFLEGREAERIRQFGAGKYGTTYEMAIGTSSVPCLFSDSNECRRSHHVTVHCDLMNLHFLH